MAPGEREGTVYVDTEGLVESVMLQYALDVKLDETLSMLWHQVRLGSWFKNIVEVDFLIH